MKKDQVKLAVCLVIILVCLSETFRILTNDPGDQRVTNEIKVNVSERVRQKRRIDMSNLDEDDQDDLYDLWKMGELAKNMLFGYKKLLLREEINGPLRSELGRKYCPNKVTQFDCDSTLSLHVRSIDGSCNNLNTWWYGKSRTSYKRLLTAHYHDNVGEPRFRSGRYQLPNPRRVASAVFDPPLETVSHWNQLMLFFAQFVANDLAQTATSYERVERGVRKVQCKCGDDDDNCFNIMIPHSDTENRDQRCMTFVRSMPATKSFDCTMGPREQVNLNTHWLDLSQLYGSTHTTARKLRTYSKGQLKSNRDATGEYLPYVQNNSICDLYNKKMTKYIEREACYLTGDPRAEDNVVLTSMHTIWLRQHNKIASDLSLLNPRWSDERLFETTRRIMIAQYQHIVYNEFLPALLGQKMTVSYRLTPEEDDYFRHYDPDIYPHVTNEFTTAAFRFAHTLVRSEFTSMDKELTYSSPKSISNYLFNNLFYKKRMNDTVRGAMFDFSYAPMTQVNKYLKDKLYEGLFRADDSIRWSLPALNIQRGRDHGLPGYIQFREWCGLPKGNRFDELSNIPQRVVEKLRSVYASTCDIDLFVGLMSERPMRDALVGETAGCIIAKQFKDLKYADRFFYESKDPKVRFKLKQLNNIRETSFMSSILCQTIDILFAQKYSFYVANSDWNKVLDCQRQPKLDLSLWRDKDAGFDESNKPDDTNQDPIARTNLVIENINSDSQDQAVSSDTSDQSANSFASISVFSLNSVDQTLNEPEVSTDNLDVSDSSESSDSVDLSGRVRMFNQIELIEETSIDQTETESTSIVTDEETTVDNTTEEQPSITTASLTTDSPTTYAISSNQHTTEEITTTDSTSTDSMTTEEITSEEQTTIGLTTESITTEEPTTTELTTEVITTTEPTTAELTTEEQTTAESTTEELTTEELITTIEPTTEELTSEELTTEELTTQELTTEEITTADSTTQELTSEELTTEEITTTEATTEELTSEELTTAEPTTEELTTEEITTEELTTQELTKEITTTEATTEELTTKELTTEKPTTEVLTTNEPSTEELTSEELTTAKITTTEATTEELTTEEITTAELTTEEQTTTESTTEELTSEELTSEEITSEAITTIQETSLATTSEQNTTASSLVSTETILEETTTEESSTNDSTIEETTLTASTLDELSSEETTYQQSTLVDTTDKPTTEELTTEQITSAEPTTAELTTEELTTEELITTIEPTTEELTTEELSTEKLTTDELTTADSTTQELTSEETTEATTEELTTEELTTQELTTEITTAELTTEEQTTTESTTEELTTEELTTKELSTTEPMTEELTTEEITTIEPTTEELTSTESTTEDLTTHESIVTTTEDITSEESTIQTTTEEETTTIIPEELIVFSSSCSIDANNSLTCSKSKSRETDFVFNPKGLDSLNLSSIDLVLNQPNQTLQVNLTNITVSHIGRLSVSASNNSHALIQFTGLLNLTIDQIDFENSNASLTIIFEEILYLTVGRMNGDFGDDSLNSIHFEQVIHKRFGSINVHSSGETTATVFDARGSQELNIGSLNLTLYNQSSFIFDGVNSTQASITNLTGQLADGSAAVFDLKFATKLTIQDTISISVSNQSSLNFDLSYSEQNNINNVQCVANSSSAVFFNFKEISNSSLTSLVCSVHDNSSLNLNATGAIELKIGNIDVSLNQTLSNGLPASSDFVFEDSVLLAINNLSINTSGNVQTRLNFDSTEGTTIQNYNSVISQSGSILLQIRQVFDLTINSVKCSLDSESSLLLNSTNSSLVSISIINCSILANSSALFDFSNNSNFSSNDYIVLKTDESSQIIVDMSDGDTDSIEVFECSGNSSSSITLDLDNSKNVSLTRINCSIGLNSSLDLDFSNSTSLVIQDIQLTSDSDSNSHVDVNLTNAVNSSISHLNITSDEETSYDIDIRRAINLKIDSLDCSIHNQSSILFNSSEAYHVTLGSIDCELSKGSSIELDFSSVETLEAPETLNFKVSNQSSVTFNMTNSTGNTIQSLNPVADTSSSIILDLNKMNNSNIGSITCNSATNSTVDVSLTNSANLNINSINIQASRIDVLDSNTKLLPYGKPAGDTTRTSQNYMATIGFSKSFLFFQVPITVLRVTPVGRCNLYTKYDPKDRDKDKNKPAFRIFPYKITSLNGLNTKWSTNFNFRSVNNASHFAMINEDVQARSTSGLYTDFNATTAIVFTWIQTYNDPETSTYQQNIFQLIFAMGDYGKSFIIFKYARLDTPNGRSYFTVESNHFDFSLTPSPSPNSSNCGIFGQFAYRVDLDSISNMPITAAFKVTSLDLMNSVNLNINTVTVSSTNYALAVVNFTNTIYLTLSAVNLLSSHYSIMNISFERASRFKTSLITTMSVTQSSTDLSYVSASDFLVSGVNLVALGTSTGYLELSNVTRGSLGAVVCQADSTSLLSLLDIPSDLVMEANSCFNSTAINTSVTDSP